MMQTSFRRTMAVVGIGVGVMLLGMFWAIVNTALASIQKDLSATILHLQWLMNCFGIFLCVPLLTMGKLGDSYGRKGLFLIGLFGMLLASFLAGSATHIGLLIACMAVFGLSGSIILPLSQALLVHQFPENQKEKAIALWSTFMSISLALGPLVGGVILNYFGWRWVFLINIPVVCLVIPLVYFFVEKEQKGAKPHCDWIGVGLLAVIVGSLIIPIMQGPNWGWSSPVTLGLFAVCLISISVFVALEQRTSAPLFRPDLFLQPVFLFTAIANGCTIGFIWVAFFLMPLYLQNMRNYSPFETGAILLLVTVPVAFLSVQVSKWYAKLGPKILLFGGFSLLLISAFVQALFLDADVFWPIGVSCICLGFGWVLSWGPSITSAISSLPHHLAGMASGMFTTLQELGAVLSLAIAGVIFREARQTYLASHMDQINQALGQMPSDQKESLLSNPAGIDAVIGTGSPIISWVRDAFISGYHEAFWFLVALSLLALVMTYCLPKGKLV